MQTIDVVIDDGGHLFEQQLTSLQTLFPRINSGGVYIIEDLAHSFKRHDPRSTLEFIKTLIEGIGMVSGDGGIEEFVASEPSTKSYIDGWKESHPEAMRLLPFIFSVSYYGNNCVIVKR